MYLGEGGAIAFGQSYERSATLRNGAVSYEAKYEALKQRPP